MRKVWDVVFELNIVDSFCNAISILCNVFVGCLVWIKWNETKYFCW